MENNAQQTAADSNSSSFQKTDSGAKKLALLSLLLIVILAVVVSVGWKKFLVVQKQLIYVEKHLLQQQKQTQKLTVEFEQQQQALQRILSNDNRLMVMQVLQEVEYRVREADLNLTYQTNIPAAITLLQMAEQRLKNLHETGIEQLRQQLVNNVTALQMIPSMDPAGLLAKLASLQQQLQKLPVFAAPKVKPRAEIKAHKIEVKDWRAGLAMTWEALQKIIVVRQRATPVQPLVTPEQYFYVKQNIELQLELAARAVLQRQDKAYQASLQQAIDWLQEYYAANIMASKGLVNILKELQKATLKPSVPDLAPTLKLLSQLQQSEIQSSANAGSQKGGIND